MVCPCQALGSLGGGANTVSWMSLLAAGSESRLHANADSNLCTINRSAVIACCLKVY